ncbi:MAG: nucleotidyltransferase family protein [Candidatus Bipolaricaulota bacterium]
MVLAAGEGRRMGGMKMLVPFHGRPLLQWTVELVQRLPLDHRVIVLGAASRQVRSRISLAGWRLAVNRGWREGIASSLRVAEATAPLGGLLVFLGDMPRVPEEACLAVISQACDVPVAPSYKGQRGFPVYLPPSLRPELSGLRGDEGARSLLAECRFIPQEDPGVSSDVDRVEDLACEAWKG